MDIYSLDNKLKEKFLDLNYSIKNRYKDLIDLSREDIRDFISKNIGEIKALEKLGKQDLEVYQEKGGILGVDGSTNKLGGSYPHFIEAYQALGKSTLYRDRPTIITHIFSPLSPEKGENPLENDEKVMTEQRNIRLSTLEVQVAIESIKSFKPYAILMDGGLIRYNIYAYEKWMELRKLCEEHGIILVGVIKDIKTSIIGDRLLNKGSDEGVSFYDRELLFGNLSYKEAIFIRDQVNKKDPEGYSSMFLRSSLAPTVIGMDIIDSQKEYMEEMGRLVLTLTPENSRGVPLWLDIVDKEVKISDQIMKALVEQYMDRDIYERFFISERDKRN